MRQVTNGPEDAVPAALEREVGLIRDAIALVATGGAPRVVVAGLALGDQLLPSAQRMAETAGVRLVPTWGADEEGVADRGGAAARMSDAADVLLVEDDESLRRIVARHLRGHGFVVKDVGSAEDAAGALERGLRPKLVLLDLNLPGDTGWDLIRGPALAAGGSPPVVLTSATTVSPKRLAEYRVAGYLPKPFPLETLVATVERFVAPEGELENR